MPRALSEAGIYALTFLVFSGMLQLLPVIVYASKATEEASYAHPVPKICDCKPNAVDYRSIVTRCIDSRIFIPRLGSYEYKTTSSAFFVELLTTDSDESLHTATAFVFPQTSGNTFDITTPGGFKFQGSASLRHSNGILTPFSGGVISDTAPDLDAFALGVRIDGTLQAFFQMRVAGSNATVSDTSLAAQAVAAGLWTEVDAYYEFPSSHAFVAGAHGGPPTGPASYYSGVIPEPSSLTLFAAVAAAIGTRRSRKNLTR